MEEMEEDEERDLDLLAFFDFFDLCCFLDLFLEGFVAEEAAMYTDPKAPPRGLTGPRAPRGIRAGSRGAKGLAVSWIFKGGLGASSVIWTWGAGVRVRGIGASSCS